MSIFAGILRSLAIVAVTWVGWRIFRSLIVKNPLAKIHGKVFAFGGLMGGKVLYTYDPKALHQVTIKDLNSYEETDDFRRTAYLTLGMGLFSSMGDHHRKQRKMLNPVFSIAYLREMTPVFYEVGHRLRKSMLKQVSRGHTEVDVLGWMTRTALELIGQSGFAYSFDSLEIDAAQHPFGASLKNLLPTMNDQLLTAVRILLVPYIYGIGTPWFKRKVVDALPWKALRQVRDMVDVMEKTSLEILDAAKKSLKSGDGPSGRKDIISLLLKANMEADEGDKLPDNELIAQVSSLTFAAMDTTSNGLCRIMSLLAEHPEVQEKLRTEIVDAFSQNDGNDLDYETLTYLPYLDAVCRESLRLHPPVPFAIREAMQDTSIPLSKPITTTDGQTTQEIFVPKGTSIFISITQCNRDPDVWGPDAEEWKPERWLSPLPESVIGAKVPGVYSNLMTFLGGGRSCIGFKFAQLEISTSTSMLADF
ncbi:cytochrome P450 [Ephemerocybe angulata]|uniref:Cytochrome P450 n=1 Tax=Ephemerocybe angulata TaxID=980116 RepID=A0A8H6HT29_9AGAR|nr:cytochrome P450 [Tulosesus angulatus]